MTFKVPPQTATWLLLRLGPQYQNGSLAGDLYEEYQSDRTRTWYWRQVLAAICIGWGMRAHKVARHLGVKRLLGVFAITALGAGTLTWAHGMSHKQQQCAYPGNPAMTADSIHVISTLAQDNVSRK